MAGIREEILGFLAAILSGGIVRLWYQCLICFRHIVKHKWLAIEIEDILFWIVTSVYLFVQIYHTSNGSVRWYFALGIVLGVAISTIFWRKFEKQLKKIYNLQSGENIAKSRKRRYYK
jgi:spore cortex biosynthesis protein YabQ